MGMKDWQAAMVLTCLCLTLFALVWVIYVQQKRYEFIARELLAVCGQANVSCSQIFP